MMTVIKTDWQRTSPPGSGKWTEKPDCSCKYTFGRERGRLYTTSLDYNADVDIDGLVDSLESNGVDMVRIKEADK